MCTELFLALIYFLIIFFVNFFLIKLIIKTIINIFYLLKIQTIHLYFKEIKNNNLWLSLNLLKINANNFSTLLYFNQIKKTTDVLIIGKTYEYLSFFLDKNKKRENPKDFYYLLLKNQYLEKR